MAKRVKVLLFPGLCYLRRWALAIWALPTVTIFPKLIEVLKGVKQLKGPVLLHVVTRKGRGYEKAEADPIKYHGVGRWNPETGEIMKTPPGPPTYTKVFSQTVCKIAQDDDKVAAITAAMPEGTGLDAFRDQFKERVLSDVGSMNSTR